MFTNLLKMVSYGNIGRPVEPKKFISHDLWPHISVNVKENIKNQKKVVGNDSV